MLKRIFNSLAMALMLVVTATAVHARDWDWTGEYRTFAPGEVLTALPENLKSFADEYTGVRYGQWEYAIAPAGLTTWVSTHCARQIAAMGLQGITDANRCVTTHFFANQRDPGQIAVGDRWLLWSPNNEPATVQAAFAEQATQAAEAARLATPLTRAEAEQMLREVVVTINIPDESRAQLTAEIERQIAALSADFTVSDQTIRDMLIAIMLERGAELGIVSLEQFSQSMRGVDVELAAIKGRLSAVETGLGDTNRLLDGTIAAQATVNTDTAAALAALQGRQTATEANLAATVGVVTALDARVAASESAAAKAAADASAALAAATAANQALAAKVDGAAVPGMVTDGISAAVADPNSVLGRALDGKVDDAELTTAGVSIWTWIFGTIVGLGALALLGLLGFYLNHRKVNGVATQVADLENRAEATEGYVSGQKVVVMPDNLLDDLHALNSGDAGYLVTVEVDGVSRQLGFSWALPKNGKAQVTVRGIKDQNEPMIVANVRSRILRAAGKGHLIGLVASTAPTFRAAPRAAAHVAAPPVALPAAPPPVAAAAP